MKKIRHISALLLTLVLALCITTAPASAAYSACKFNVSSQAVQGNLSRYNLPSAQTPTQGQTFYINVSATEDFKFTRARFFVKAPNASNYSCVYDYAPGGYFRWCYTPYTFSKSGTYAIKISLTKTTGGTMSGSTSIAVAAGAGSSAASSGNTMTWNGACYTVVPNAGASQYRYNQRDYSRFVNSRGQNVGCTATAMACAYSIRHNTALSPNSVSWSSAGCSWEYATRLTDGERTYSPYTYSTQEALQAVYRSIANRGLAVIIGVTGAGMDHVVTAIGFREGANPYNLSLQDLLIIDPNGGEVTSLAKYSGIDTGWSLRVPI